MTTAAVDAATALRACTALLLAARGVATSDEVDRLEAEWCQLAEQVDGWDVDDCLVQLYGVGGRPHVVARFT